MIIKVYDSIEGYETSRKLEFLNNNLSNTKFDGTKLQINFIGAPNLSSTDILPPTNEGRRE